MINILIDTNIIRQEGFESQQMQLLLRLVQGEKVNVFIPDIVKREYLTQKVSEISDNLHNICRKIDRFQREKLFNAVNNEKLRKITKYLKGLNENITESFAESFQNWVEKLEATIIEVDPFCLENILEDYFAGKNAFRRPKSREDFPDALIMAAILETLEEYDSLYIVLKDGHFRDCLNTYDKITTAPTLKELFSFSQFEKEINALDAESERIQSIKKYLAKDDCKEKLEDFIYSEQSDICKGYWDENEISDSEGVLELKFISVYIEEIDMATIDNLTFGKINYLGEEAYTIECAFTATVGLNLVTDYGDYIHLEENSRNHFEFVSADGEVCELKTDVSCNFIGNIELDITEKLMPEQLALHFQYLHTDESPIFATADFDKVIITGR